MENNNIVNAAANLENVMDWPGHTDPEKMEEIYDKETKEFYEKIGKMKLRKYTLGEPFKCLGGLAYIYHGKALYHGEEYDAYAGLVDEVHDLPCYDEMCNYIGTDYNLSDIYDEVVEAFAELAPFDGNFAEKYDNLEALIESNDYPIRYRGWEEKFFWRVLDAIYKKLIVENVELYLEYNPSALEVVMREIAEVHLLPDFLFSGEYFSMEEFQDDVNEWRS